MYAVTVEMVQGYASWCVHCWDYYAVQQRDGSYRPSSQCLSLSRLADHLLGCYTLGTYVLDPSGSCAFAVFDADSEDGLERLGLLSAELVAQGMRSVLEASRRGGHLWLFLRRPTPARVVRRWLGPYAAAYEMELYPKQDILRPGGMGNLVRLPLGVHRQSGGWYPFVVPGPAGVLVPVGETVAACCLWLAEWGERVEVPAQDWQAEEEGEEAYDMGGCAPGSGAIRAWCQAQDIVEVVGRYTALDRRGVGRCPLPGHHDRGDVRPSLQVFGGTDAHWYCYTWGRAGNVFDFLRFYHGLTVQQAWERLQQGVLG